MSTNKLLQSLSEDPQLEKQIGCMAGILQLFDRHQVLTGRRLYGHKRISAAASKTQTSPSSNCGSPASETSAASSETMLRHPSDNVKQKNATAAGIAASPEQQKSQTLPMPSTPTDVKSSSALSRTPSFPVNESSPPGSSGDQFPQVSFEMARSSILTPRRLDSSRSLHEGRINASHESKVFARRSVDTAERAAAAARGALKELSRISTADFTGPSQQTDQVSFRDIVRSSFGKEQPVSKSTANPSLSISSGSMHSAFASRMSNEESICALKPGLAKDMSRAQYVEAKSFAECNPAEKTMHSAAFASQAAGRVEASRPPRPYKTKPETPTKSCADISESLRLLAKLREATPAYSSLLGSNVLADNTGNKVQFPANHVPHLATSALDIAKEEPIAFASRAPLPKAPDRIPGRMSSYEPSRSSSVDILLQGGPKAREIPRLSLDGRGPGAGFKVDQEAGTQGKTQYYPRSLLNSRSVSCSNSDCDTESLHEKRTSFSSNVVAKLMGLDEMPNSESAEPAQMQNKLDPYGSLDQKAPRMANTAVQDANPTFSQCGKYVSASFFPSKRRDDIKIAMLPEEEEEDSYLQMEPFSHQEARTLSVRVGSSNLQAGHRLATTGNTHNIGHPCYQPKNHHLIEDRPPHVLSPAARLCAQIEEMQRADFLYKDVDRGTRTMDMQQSSQQDLEALKQLLGAIHLNKEYSKGAGSRFEKLEMMATTGKQQIESGRSSYLQEQYAEQQPPPSAVIWKTKRMLNDELYAQSLHQNPRSRRIPGYSHNRKVKNATQGPDSLRLSRQHASPEIYNQASRTRSEMRSLPAASSHPSTYSTPRKTNISNDCITPIGTTNSNSTIMARRLASRTTSPPKFMSPRLSTSPQTPFSQQLRQSYHSSCSWDGSSVSSTASSHAKDQNSWYNTSDKKNKQVEKVERKKVANTILKDKEECKSTLVSVKPSPNTPVEKRSNSSVGSRSNARTGRRCMPPQNSESVRSNMRSPTKSSARKTEDVKRRLNFVNRSPGRIRHVENMDSEGQDTEFVDKTIVSSINNNESSKIYACVHQSNENARETGHEEQPFSSADTHGNQQTNTPSNNSASKAEVEVKSPQLLLPCADEETNHNGQEVTASIFSRDHRGHITGDVGSPTTPICTPAGTLKLSQLPQQENEDTESQGDKSTGSCEQPSPISVLEGPFYEEDISSPPTSTTFGLKLEEMEEEAKGKVLDGECEIPKGSPELSECGLPCPDQAVQFQDRSATDFDYVKQLLDLMGRTIDAADDERRIVGMLKLRPVEPHTFLQLEGENLNSGPGCKSEVGTMWRRRLIFDSVNASLERRLRGWRQCQRQPWVLACESGLHGVVSGDCSMALQQGIIGLDEERDVCLSGEGRRVLLEEVWEEIRKQGGKKRRNMGAEEEEEADDGKCDDVGRILEEDMFGGPFHTRCADTWAYLHVEKGELGLDLERLIFKDLIDHTIRDLGLFVLPPTTKRQLFKLHK